MARMRKPKASIPDNIAEEYYQISQEILTSFPKYRPPVDLFKFRDDSHQLYPYCRKGARLTNEQVEEVSLLCDNGQLFVSRSDHPIYSEHIVKQVDLVLLDANLKESEASDIIVRALQMRFSAFIEQPVRPVFESLYADLMVLTEFIWQDKHRVKLFMRRLLLDYNLTNHSLNSLFVGLWLYVYTYAGESYKRRMLDRSALGLLVHDIGMSKIPAFILSRPGPLKNEDRDKLVLHPFAGIKVMQKLDLGFDEMNQAIMEHHERLDGSGYPNHAKDSILSRFGRMVAVADSFSAMICERPYTAGKPVMVAARELAADKNKYDTRFTTPLHNAFLTGKFELTLPEEDPTLLNDEDGEPESLSNL